MKRSIKGHRRERGAVAVEFALIAPVLLLLLAGIVEFAHTYNVQISVTQAAREAARTYAITNDWDQATAAGITGAPGLDAANFSFIASNICGDPDEPDVTVTAEYTASTITGFSMVVTGNQVTFPGTFTLTGVGAMRCGG
jgi:Flp pilus assembly protein TadG